MNLIKSEIGGIIRKERKKRGLSTEEAAKLMGISRSYMNLVERGERNFSFEKTLKFCNIFGVSPEQLLFGSYDRHYKCANLLELIDVELKTMNDEELETVLSIIKGYKMRKSDILN